MCSSDLVCASCGCGGPLPCPGTCGRRAKSGGGRQQRRQALSQLQRPLRQRLQVRPVQLCPASGCSMPRCTRCRPARVPWRRSSSARPRRMASTISGFWATDRCQAPCRQRMAVCRAFGVAPGAAAWPATPPGPRFLPGNLAAGPSGWQRRPLTPWSWTASTGDVAGAGSRFGRSTPPSPADRPAQCQSSPLPVPTGRQESSASAKCLVG